MQFRRFKIVRISPLNVEISGNGSHGVLINDQVNPSVPEDEESDPLPPGPNPNGSDAAVDVTVLGSCFSGNGNIEGVDVSDNVQVDMLLTQRRAMARSTKAIWTMASTSTNGTTAMSS